MFPMTITINTPAQLEAVISVLKPEGVVARQVPKDKPEKPVQQAAEKAKPEPTKEKPAAEPEKPKDELSYDKVAAVVSRYAGRDRKGALAILEAHGLTSFRDAKPEQFKGIHDDFSKALAASAH